MGLHIRALGTDVLTVAPDLVAGLSPGIVRPGEHDLVLERAIAGHQARRRFEETSALGLG